MTQRGVPPVKGPIICAGSAFIGVYALKQRTCMNDDTVLNATRSADRCALKLIGLAVWIALGGYI